MSGGALAETANATLVLLATSSMSVTATTTLIDSDGVKGASAGDTVAYEIELSNTGTTTLVNITVFDAMLGEQVHR